MAAQQKAAGMLGMLVPPPATAYTIDCTANSTAQKIGNPSREGEAAPIEDKQFQTLRATLALYGHQLHRSDRADGSPVYFASRWDLVRHFDSLAQVRDFARMVGGAS